MMTDFGQLASLNLNDQIGDRGNERAGHTKFFSRAFILYDH